MWYKLLHFNYAKIRRFFKSNRFLNVYAYVWICFVRKRFNKKKLSILSSIQAKPFQLILKAIGLVHSTCRIMKFDDYSKQLIEICKQYHICDSQQFLQTGYATAWLCVSKLNSIFHWNRIKKPKGKLNYPVFLFPDH